MTKTLRSVSNDRSERGDEHTVCTRTGNSTVLRSTRLHCTFFGNRAHQTGAVQYRRVLLQRCNTVSSLASEQRAENVSIVMQHTGARTVQVLY